MGIVKLLKTGLDLLSGKANATSDKIIENNPEIMLQQAIEAEIATYEKDELAIGNLNREKNKVLEDIEKRKDDLKKIQRGISAAQKEHNTEDIQEGMSLYKQRENEIIELQKVANEIVASVTEATNQLKEKKKQIGNLQHEKTNLMAKLKIAEQKERILELTGGLNKNSNTSTREFEKIKNIIENKINTIKGVEEVRKETTSSSSRFKGL